jgi:uncharacterized protein
VGNYSAVAWFLRWSIGVYNGDRLRNNNSPLVDFDIFIYYTKKAVGTSLGAILFTATAATLNYSKQKRIYYRTGLILASGTVPGAIFGAYLTSITSSVLLGLFFGFFLMGMSIYIVIEAVSRKRKSAGEEQFATNFEKDLFTNKKMLGLGVSFGFLGGVASGLLGIGGGLILVPILTFILMMPIHFAVATSMLTMIITALSGTMQHFFLGNINFEYALLIGVGSIVGAQIGTYACKRISGENLRSIFGLLLWLVSFQMLLKFIVTN